MLTNLLKNSLKYTKEGYIQLSVTKEDSKEIIERAFGEDHEIPSALSSMEEELSPILVKFEVSDSGCGIPLEQKEHLFKLFAHARSKSFSEENPCHAGMGLFLS